MSIIQEYDYILNLFNNEELKKIDDFLKNNPMYYLSDLLYKEEVYKEFKNFLKNK